MVVEGKSKNGGGGLICAQGLYIQGEGGGYAPSTNHTCRLMCVCVCVCSQTVLFVLSLSPLSQASRRTSNGQLVVPLSLHKSKRVF